MKSEWLTNAALVVLVGCALTVTTLRVYEHFAPTPSDTQHRSVVVVREWRKYAVRGPRIGVSNAPVTIVEFSDFQCPACASLATTIRNVRDRMKDTVAIVYRHYPLSIAHPFATAAAMASECASDQGRFEAVHDYLFRNQKAIGTVSWDSVAVAVAIPDQREFRSCVKRELAADRIVRDTIAASELGVAATPTFLVNDQLIVGAISEETLETFIRQAYQKSMRREGRS